MNSFPMIRIMNKFKKIRNDEPSLTVVIVISAVIHALLFVLFVVVPSIGKAEPQLKPKAIMFKLEVADRLGSGVGGTPKKGPVNDGRIELPLPAPQSIPQSAPVLKQPEANTKKKAGENTVKPKTSEHSTDDLISDALREAIRQYNEGREGEFTRPDGDPDSRFVGPGGTPGGDSCAVYRNRQARYIRKAGSVPEAVGKSVSITVSVNSAGAVTSKTITKSSGLQHVDKLALGLVPSKFQVPPPECGNVTIRVTVRFQGDSGGIDREMPSRPKRTTEPAPKKTHVPDDIDRALRELN